MKTTQRPRTVPTIRLSSSGQHEYRTPFVTICNQRDHAAMVVYTPSSSSCFHCPLSLSPAITTEHDRWLCSHVHKEKKNVMRFEA
ncbi:hypothetical protein BaRGS_00026601 [Batillaria attramentaria]|uniref:Uncharacterized protein n=1 Tax=Batillaria attramentaria TaxID=370345 RepID=A0ABD0K477_9CAEN